MVKEMDKGSRVIAYVRVSTEEQGTNGVGLKAQMEQIQAEIDRRAWVLSAVHEDVLSGRHLNRPGLQSALEALEAGDADGILVAKLDRLSRSLIDFASLLARAQARGWNLIALDLGVDLSTPHGEFLANVMASAAQWERRIIGQRTKDALAVKRAQGVRLGRPASIPPKLRARIKTMRTRKGMTLQAICNQLNAEGIPTARGGVEWRPTSLRAVLKA
jgi:DNA invertase Pin-like site-specific DNA recombinase